MPKLSQETWSLADYRAYVASGGKTKPVAPAKPSSAVTPLPPAKSPLQVKWDGIWGVLADAPPYVEELQAIDGRKFRFDMAWLHPETGKPILAVELDGTTKQGGRHQRSAGFEQDAVKYLLGTLVHGWTILKLTRGMITPEYLVLVRNFIRDRSQ